MKYILDTNICIYLLNKRNDKNLRTYIDNIPPHEIGISIITLCELEYGITKSRHPKLAKKALAPLLHLYQVLPLPMTIADEYGTLKSYLHKQGTPIGSNDLFIAAHAITLGQVLVTNDSDFNKVPGLKIENWTE